MNDVFVRLVQLDADVKGLVVPFGDGDYRIYINAIYSAEQQREIYNHEVRHILRNHHYMITDVEQVELEAEDRESMLESIKEVEEKGLPLVSAITKQIKPVAKEIDDLDAILFNLDTLAEEQAKWQEQLADRVERYRDYKLVENQSW